MDHDPRAEQKNFMTEVVAAEKFGTCEFVCNVETGRKVGERGEAGNGIGNARLDHERNEADCTAGDF